MTSIVVFSLCLLLTIRSIACIDCYSCTSADNPDCVNPERHMKKRMCDSDGLRQTGEYAIKLNADYREIFDFTTIEKAIPLNCLKQVVKVDGNDVIFRGCQLPRDTKNQLDVCKKVYDLQNKNQIQVSHCSLCDTDGCNGAPPSHSWPLAAFGALLLGALAAVF